MTGSLDIPDNLAMRAAQAAMGAMRTTGRVEMRLTKRIPMGAGLGGGSSDAAAVLLTLPVLAGSSIAMPKLCQVAGQLGSDVPFFLLGGTVLGVGRGTELCTLPDAPASAGIIVAPGIHVSTAEAYGLLGIQEKHSRGGAGLQPANDFEEVVFAKHPRLAAIKERLVRTGASTAMMTGSGSALFGLFKSASDAARAMESMRPEKTFRVSLVSRARYHSLWWRALEEHIAAKTWPPLSRY